MSSQPASEVRIRITVSPSALPKLEERAAAGWESRGWPGMEDFTVDWQVSSFREADAMTAYWSRELPAGADRLGTHVPGTTGASFSIVIGRCGGTVVVTLEGALDTLAAALLAARLEDLIDDQGNLAVAVNLRGLDYVASSGLQVLSRAASNLERRGGSLSLREPADAVLRALAVAGPTRLIGHTPVTGIRRSGQEPSPVLGASTNARALHPAGTGRRWNPYGCDS